MTKWDRMRPSKRQRDALNRATTSEKMPPERRANHVEDASPHADHSRQLSNATAAWGNDPSCPLRSRIEGLIQGGEDELHRDVMFDIAQLAVRAFPDGSGGTDETIRTNPSAAPLLRFFLDSLLRYRDAYEPLNKERGGKIPTKDFRAMLEDVFLLSNRQGRRGFTLAVRQRILFAFRQKIDEILPRDWEQNESALTRLSIDSARQLGFEAAFAAHYGRSPHTGDNDKNDVERIRRVLSFDPFWSRLAISSTAGVKLNL